MIHTWPSLNYAEWKETYQTLHRWLQVVGKLKLSLFPWTNHSWHTVFFVSSRGLTTGSMPYGEKNLTVDFDFIDHRIVFSNSIGLTQEFKLQNESVSSFFERFKLALNKMDVNVSINPYPNECLDYIPFFDDDIHDTYNRDQAHRCFQVLVRVNNVLQSFRSHYVGKSSPVHFFWGSFDLAVTRFSGRTAPEHPGIAPHLSPLVVKEAYSHEVYSCGFWPGNDIYPHAAFYSYAYPEPSGFGSATIKPLSAFYHSELREFLLPYNEVIKASNPEALILEFLQSTYGAATTLGKWPTHDLEESPYLRDLRSKTNWYHVE